MAETFWLSAEQGTAIAPLPLPFGGKPRVDDRRVIDRNLHQFREGLHWRVLPAMNDLHTTVFNRFNRRSERGLWQENFTARRTTTNHH